MAFSPVDVVAGVAEAVAVEVGAASLLSLPLPDATIVLVAVAPLGIFIIKKSKNQ